jgi:transcriptional regulator GlxA family with amidase domain
VTTAPRFFAAKDRTMHKTRNVGILIFQDVEVLDFCGPFEVFSVAGRQIAPGAFNVFTIARTLDAVLARNGLSVNPKTTLALAPALDLLLIPGGLGTRPLMHDAELLKWIKDRAQSAELLLSVCTGALLLGKAGLLDGLSATTHHGALDLLRDTAPHATVLDEQRVVDNGRVITSAGIAAGIDMSLHVVAKLLGPETAQATARYMEYPWQGD